MTDEQELFEIARVFITDGTFSDAKLASWDSMIQSVVTNDAFITDQVFISRSAIVKMIRMTVVLANGQPRPDLASILDFPKGSA